MTTILINAFTDNYIWAISEKNRCIVIDPGDAAPVIHFLNTKNLELDAIFITHHHNDHTAGVQKLVDLYQPKVYGSKKEGIPCLSHPVTEGDNIHLPMLALTFDVLFVPGHTADHLAYYAKPSLFCGDTLFSAGCGRIFEGTSAQMFASLNKIKAMPDDTLIYCAHEYTLNNLRFAEAVEPNNPDIQIYQTRCQTLIKQGQATIPSFLGEEKKVNPFLRCDQAEIRQSAEQHVGHGLTSEEAVFAVIRTWKNTF